MTEADQASIFWLIGPQRNEYKATAVEKNGYLNEFPCDQHLLTKDLFIPLIQASYPSFNKVETEESQSLIDESYLVNTQLPALVGRFYERENNLEDNTWAVVGGMIP